MNELTKKRIGQRLNEVLSKRGILQKELAEHIGVTANTVSYYLSGERCPDMEKLIEISRFLNVSTDYLLGVSNELNIDVERTAVSQYTGLSERAVDLLHWYCDDNERSEIINILLEDADYSEEDKLIEELVKAESENCDTTKILANIEKCCNKRRSGLLSCLRNYLLFAVGEDEKFNIEDIEIVENGKILTPDEYCNSKSGETENTAKKGKRHYRHYKGTARIFNKNDIIENVLLSEIQDSLKELKRILKEGAANGNDN